MLMACAVSQRQLSGWVVHASNPSAWEEETGSSASTNQSTRLVLGLPGQPESFSQRETNSKASRSERGALSEPWAHLLGLALGCWVKRITPNGPIMAA